MTDDEETITLEEPAGESPVEPLPVTLGHACQCVRFASGRCISGVRVLIYVIGVTLLALAAWAVLAGGNMVLLVRPLSQAINGATHNMSTGCPFQGPCSTPVVCADDANGFIVCYFAISLPMVLGEVILAGLIYLSVKGCWDAYSREQSRVMRSTVKNE